MTELGTLRSYDATIHAALEGSGLAGVGFYTAPAANFDVRCRIFIDRAVQVLGEFGQVVASRDEMRLFLEDVADPKAKGRMLVESSPGAGIGETWQLVEKVAEDGSLSRWVVKRV